MKWEGMPAGIVTADGQAYQGINRWSTGAADNSTHRSSIFLGKRRYRGRFSEQPRHEEVISADGITQSANSAIPTKLAGFGLSSEIVDFVRAVRQSIAESDWSLWTFLERICLGRTDFSDQNESARGSLEVRLRKNISLRAFDPNLSVRDLARAAIRRATCLAVIDA